MGARDIELVGQWNECAKKERMWGASRVERTRKAQGEGEEVKGKKAKVDGSMNEVGESKGNREAVKDKSWGSTLQLFLGSRCQAGPPGCLECAVGACCVGDRSESNLRIGVSSRDSSQVSMRRRGRRGEVRTGRSSSHHTQSPWLGRGTSRQRWLTLSGRYLFSASPLSVPLSLAECF